MRKIFLLIAAFLLCASVGAAQQNHGVTLTWPADTSAATCLSTSSPACTSGYNIFEGPASGQESTTPLNSSLITVLTFTDNGSAMNSYLGTTRCYTYQFQETFGGTLVLTSASSNEVCFSFPAIPATPGTLSGSMH